MARVVKYKTHYKTMQKMKEYRRDRDSWTKDYEKLYELACVILNLAPSSELKFKYAMELSWLAVYRTDDYMKMITHPDFMTGELIDEKVIEYKVPNRKGKKYVKNK